MLKPAPRPMTVEQFVDWDSGDDRRYELIDGAPMAMAPPSRAHQIVVSRLAGLIDSVLEQRPPCTVQVEAGIVPLRPQRHHYYQADLAVTCRPHEPGEYAVPEPLLIIEVLSRSNRGHDWVEKLHDYQALPSVREILLIEPTRALAVLHRRIDEDRWETQMLRSLASVLRLETVGLEVALERVYRGVALKG